MWFFYSLFDFIISSSYFKFTFNPAASAATASQRRSSACFKYFGINAISSAKSVMYATVGGCCDLLGWSQYVLLLECIDQRICRPRIVYRLGEHLPVFLRIPYLNAKYANSYITIFLISTRIKVCVCACVRVCVFVRVCERMRVRNVRERTLNKILNLWKTFQVLMEVACISTRWNVRGSLFLFSFFFSQCFSFSLVCVYVCNGGKGDNCNEIE